MDVRLILIYPVHTSKNATQIKMFSFSINIKDKFEGMIESRAYDWRKMWNFLVSHF